MTTIEPTADESTDLEPRDVRALTEYHSVLDDIDDENDDGRPDNCECWDADADLPCFACWMAGHRAPNPEVTDT